MHIGIFLIYLDEKIPMFYTSREIIFVTQTIVCIFEQITWKSYKTAIKALD